MPRHTLFRQWPKNRSPTKTGVLTAADLVQAALQAEAEGDAARREALLREALDKDPDYAPRGGIPDTSV